MRVNPDGSHTRYDADEEGYITARAGDLIRFADPKNPERFVPVNSLIFHTKTTPLKIELNGNGLYPFYVGANQYRGVERMRVTRIMPLTDCSFYYEGMTI